MEISPIGLPPRTRLYRLERAVTVGVWRLWIAQSPDGYGTYLALYDTGKIERVTLRNDVPEERDIIKGDDGFR